MPTTTPGQVFCGVTDGCVLTPGHIETCCLADPNTAKLQELLERQLKTKVITVTFDRMLTEDEVKALAVAIKTAANGGKVEIELT